MGALLLVYYLLYWPVTLAFRAYYRHIQVRGRSHVPRAGGPAIICSTHPNMACDPAMVGHAVGRNDPSYWTKSTLFRGFLGWLVRAMGAVPVYRRQDFPEGTPVDNTMLFAASFKVLQSGECIVIYPEGTSRTEPTLLPIRGGAIHLALAYLQKYKISLPIVPCGINYGRKDRFRSDVLIQFGQPLYIPEELLQKPESEEAAIIEQYTQVLRERMLEVYVHASDWETLDDVLVARQLLVNGRQVSGPETWLRAANGLTTLFEKHGKEEAVIRLKQDVRNYRAKLKILNLKDSDLSSGAFLTDALPLLVMRLIALCLVAPLAIIGGLLHAPIYAFAAWVGTKAPDVESRTALKLAPSLVLTTPFCYISAFIAVYISMGFTHLLGALIVFPILGWLHLTALDYTLGLGKSIYAMVRITMMLLTGYSTSLEKTVKRREALIDRLHAVFNKYPAASNDDIKKLCNATSASTSMTWQRVLKPETAPDQVYI